MFWGAVWACWFAAEGSGTMTTKLSMASAAGRVGEALAFEPGGGLVLRGMEDCTYTS